MKALKNIFVFNLLLIMSCTANAQKQNFDVVSYTLPKGWKQEQYEGGMQLSISDKTTGLYAIAIVYKSIATTALAQENFDASWEKLVKGTVQVKGEASMQKPIKQNGWDIISGGANYTDGAHTGLVTLLTATGSQQTVSVALLTNTKNYQNDLSSFISSLELKNPIENNNNTNTNRVASKIVGMWVNYNTETSGYANGYPQLSGGYMRREYVFYNDGTYLYRAKDWMVYVKEILFVYETGAYVVKGNQITLTPKNGKGEWWGKASSGRTVGWGNLIRTSTDYKLEPVSYTFDFTQYQGDNEITLILKSTKSTVRDGNNGDKSIMQEFRYKSRDKNTSLIDNPPGVKTGFENKQLNASAASTTTSSSQKATIINTAVTGKLWKSQLLEKHGAAYGNMSGFHTGGFWIYQYKFNTDGSYQFVYNAASAIATNPVNLLQYESGTYTVNGNQLTITPLKGTNEEWSVGKINNGMSAETIRKTLEKRIKLLKTSPRKLEKITYPFTIEYWQGNEANALCLKHTQDTQREGSPGTNNQKCFFETKATQQLTIK